MLTVAAISGAPAPACSSPLILNAGPNRLGVTVSALTPSTTHLRVHLFTKDSKYLVDVPDFRAETVAREVASMAIVDAPPDGPVLAMQSETPDGGAGECESEYSVADAIKFEISASPKTVSATLVPEPGYVAPTCARPFVASTLARQHELEYPLAARATDTSGAAEFYLRLDTAGTLTQAVLLQTSGSKLLDDSAFNAARGSTYRPQVVLCEARPGWFRYDADFETQVVR